MKKFLVWLSVLTLLAGLFVPACVVAEAAEAETVVVNASDAESNAIGYFVYSVSGSKVTIDRYLGSAKTVRIPARIGGKLVTAIGDGAFKGSRATYVTIPNGVKSIGSYAFANTRLKTVSIPKSVISISKTAFKGARVTRYVAPKKTLAYLYGRVTGLLNEKGALTAGWKKYGTSYFYLMANGKLASGWKTLDGVKYYFGDDYSMAVGWLKLGSKWYFMDSSGAMQTGWLLIGSDYYYFKPNGVMATGWLSIGTSMYYLNPKTGAMARGTVVIGGRVHVFAETGEWQYSL